MVSTWVITYWYMEYMGVITQLYTNHLLTSWDIQVCCWQTPFWRDVSPCSYSQSVAFHNTVFIMDSSHVSCQRSQRTKQLPWYFAKKNKNDPNPRNKTVFKGWWTIWLSNWWSVVEPTHLKKYDSQSWSFPETGVNIKNSFETTA